MVFSPLAVHRTILVVDVERFGDPVRTDLDRLVVRDGVYRGLREALAAAGVGWFECHHEDRGDGVLVVIPPTVAKAILVESLPGHLVSTLEAHNLVHDRAQWIRLRMALHAGEIRYDDHGVVGRAVDHTFCLIGAEECRIALARNPGVLAVITSSWFFEEVVRHSRAQIGAAFQPIPVVVKETETTAWICAGVPGSAGGHRIRLVSG